VVELTEVRNNIRNVPIADVGTLQTSETCPFLFRGDALSYLNHFGDDVLPGPHFLYAVQQDCSKSAATLQKMISFSRAAYSVCPMRFMDNATSFFSNVLTY
jgi:hypothetical protein